MGPPGGTWDELDIGCYAFILVTGVWQPLLLLTESAGRFRNVSKGKMGKCRERKRKGQRGGQGQEGTRGDKKEDMEGEKDGEGKRSREGEKGEERQE